jgi:hypothetical protein
LQSTLVNLFTIKEKNMKKKLFALSGVFLIVLVVTGLWATRATDLMNVLDPEQNDQGAATLVNGMTMQEMTESASLIVVGKCLETRSQWVERSLYTLATVSVTDTLKGEAAETLTVAMPGGIDANRRFPVAMTYAGAPQMSPDEEVVLFLDNKGGVANSYAVVGFAAGKFSIVRNTAGESVVTRDRSMEPIQEGPGLTRGNLQSIPLEDFKGRIRNFLR